MEPHQGKNILEYRQMTTENERPVRCVDLERTSILNLFQSQRYGVWRHCDGLPTVYHCMAYQVIFFSAESIQHLAQRELATTAPGLYENLLSGIMIQSCLGDDLEGRGIGKALAEQWPESSRCSSVLYKDDESTFSSDDREQHSLHRYP